MEGAGNGNFTSDSLEGAMVSQGFVSKEGLVSDDFRKQVNGFGLTTAHILYRRPDHQWLLQSYVWQAYDLFPKFPELQKLSGVLAGQAGRPAAFGAGRALQADQAGRAQGDQRRVSAALTLR